MNEFECDLAFQELVPCDVDLAHPALSDEVAQRVALRKYGRVFVGHGVGESEGVRVVAGVLGDKK